MNLLIVLPYHAKDAALAKQLLEWIAESDQRDESWMGTTSALMACDSAVDPEIRTNLNVMAKSLFRYAETMIVNVPEQSQGWPRGANWMFHEASRQVQECYRLPFLWLEPDSVPLKPLWFETLKRNYEFCPKKYMGCFVKGNNPNLPPIHMAGVGIYPQDAHSLLKQYCVGAEAWDIASAHAICGQHRAVHTPLIHHIWGDHTEVPVFGVAKTANNILTLDAIPKEAVLFHRCKDATLINLLRGKNTPEPSQKATPAPVTPELQIA